ncbi:hypothetical protein P8452_06394 [Trifolium repens]|nr:hypothetical protein P8452_06394 [Trifolium repens]
MAVLIALLLFSIGMRKTECEEISLVCIGSESCTNHLSSECDLACKKAGYPNGECLPPTLSLCCCAHDLGN